MRSFIVPVRRPEPPVALGDGLEVGRGASCTLRLDDQGVSSRHCRIFARAGGVFVEDLGSTNGTFLDGQRVTTPVPFPLGATLRLGRVQLRHELRSAEQEAFEAELRTELQSAAKYVETLLPPPMAAGRFQAHWRFLPSLQLGGDSFGYAPLDDTQIAIFLIDVCGHGLRAALHSVSVLNALRQRTVPGADFRDPGSVLTHLNSAFQMDHHGGMYFTLWYGVLDLARERLRFASGGHPPALVVRRGSREAARLQSPSPPVGAFEEMSYTTSETDFERGARLYLFSDGVFEEPGPDGRPIGLPWLEGLIAGAEGALSAEPSRIENALRDAAGSSRFEDDFSLIVATSS